MKDSHGRTIDYLRISLTDRCNLRCIYCMPDEGVEQMSHEDILRIEEIEEAVRVAATMGITRVRLTGGEPLVRKGVVDLIRSIKNTPGIEHIAMTTNRTKGSGPSPQPIRFPTPCRCSPGFGPNASSRPYPVWGTGGLVIL